MKHLMLATVSTAVMTFASPSWATNIALSLQNGIDIVTATGTDNVTIGPETLLGVATTLSNGTRDTHPNQLSETNILISNNTLKAQTFDMAVGAIGYLGHASAFDESATILLTRGKADLSGSFWVDALDRQSGLLSGTDTHGVDVTNFNSGLLSGPFSFAFNGLGHDNVSGPYSMAEQLTLTLQPGAAVGVQGISMTAVPEPKTWVMGLIGFAFLGALGLRRSKKDRLATI